MKADLYVYAGSFAYEEGISEQDILKRLQTFKELTQKVDASDNTFRVNFTELFQTPISKNGMTIADAFEGKMKGSVAKTYQQLIVNIFTSGTLKPETSSGQEIDSLIGSHDQYSCKAKVVLSDKNIYDPEKHLVGTYDDWQRFRVHFLGLYPINSDNFYNECKKIFNNIIFSEKYKDATIDVLESHSEKIAQGLLEVERFLISEFKGHKGSRINFPEIFAKNHSFDDGSFQGSNQDKTTFEMEFPKIGKLNCEPHLKFNSPDDSKKNKPKINIYCRIYFFMPTEARCDKVYIGAIVRHL